MLRARKGGTAKPFAKFLSRYSCELSKIRIHQRLIGLEVRIRGDRSPAIPRANILADIATEDVSADPVTHILGNRSSFLDREIGDAAGRVELTRSNDRLRRTCIDT